MGVCCSSNESYEENQLLDYSWDIMLYSLLKSSKYSDIEYINEKVIKIKDIKICVSSYKGFGYGRRLYTSQIYTSEISMSGSPSKKTKDLLKIKYKEWITQKFYDNNENTKLI